MLWNIDIWVVEFLVEKYMSLKLIKFFIVLFKIRFFNIPSCLVTLHKSISKLIRYLVYGIETWYQVISLKSTLLLCIVGPSWSIANNFVIDFYCRCLEILWQIAFTGKKMSDVLIYSSINPQYSIPLLGRFTLIIHQNSISRTSTVHRLFWVSRA